MKSILIITLVLVLSGISYLFTVGLGWLTVWLTVKAFGITLTPNYWILGALIWTVLFVINSGANSK